MVSWEPGALDLNQQAATAMTASEKTPTGTQTLERAFAIVDVVARGTHGLEAIGQAVGCTRSTCHRLLSALVGAGYLRHAAGAGYHLGPTLMTLGFLARDQFSTTAAARPWLQKLAEFTGDTVHLAVRDKADVLYATKISGSRRLEAASRVGYRMPLAWTGVGRAMLLDDDEKIWHQVYDEAMPAARATPDHPPLPAWPQYRRAMREYAAVGCVFDLEENEPGICCVAAPVRDASGSIIASISVSGAAQYMPQRRMISLRPVVTETARSISRDLGWQALGDATSAK